MFIKILFALFFSGCFIVNTAQAEFTNKLVGVCPSTAQVDAGAYCRDEAYGKTLYRQVNVVLKNYNGPNASAIFSWSGKPLLGRGCSKLVIPSVGQFVGMRLLGQAVNCQYANAELSNFSMVEGRAAVLKAGDGILPHCLPAGAPAHCLSPHNRKGCEFVICEN